MKTVWKLQLNVTVVQILNCLFNFLMNLKNLHVLHVVHPIRILIKNFKIKYVLVKSEDEHVRSPQFR